MVRYTQPIILNDYPTSDGRPMAETDWHRDLMLRLIETLKRHYESESNIYVSGNLLVFYKPNDKRRHVSPDVFVVRGVPARSRPNYLIWEEGKAPEIVIELTSKTTRKEDLNSKFQLYRDVIGVKEYFLFDPREDYLTPSMQGYRLVGGQYRAIRAKDGRMPSRILGMHLERAGDQLRFWNPETEHWIPTPEECEADVTARADEEQRRADEEQRRADEEQRRADEEQRRADEEQRRADEERDRRLAAEAEVARLRGLLARQSHHANGKNGANGH
jgi:Uma2 family endonuclease